MASLVQVPGRLLPLRGLAEVGRVHRRQPGLHRRPLHQRQGGAQEVRGQRAIPPGRVAYLVPVLQAAVSQPKTPLDPNNIILKCESSSDAADAGNIRDLLKSRVYLNIKELCTNSFHVFDLLI